MKIVAIDGNSILNRAFYGVGPLNAPDGTPTNGLYGFISILNKLVADEQPDGLCVMFDVKAPTFRHKEYDQYKAGRRPMPEELAVQFPLLREYLSLCNIPCFSHEGFEADDLLGHISHLCATNGHQCRIVTGDRDAFQLITESTQVLHISSRMGKTETTCMDIAAIQEKYGLTPAQLIDLKALMGDASDNIPGVPGVGEKTALDLMHRFGDLDTLYQEYNTTDLKAGVVKKLTEGKDSAYLSRSLARITFDTPLVVSFEEIRLTSPEAQALGAFYDRLAFKKLRQKLDSVIANVANATDINSGTLATSENAIATKQTFALPPVTVVNNADDIVALENAAAQFSGVMSIAMLPDGTAVGICLGDTVFVLQLQQDGVEACLSRLFSNESPKAGHHIKQLLRKWRVTNITMDTALAAYLLNPVHGQYYLETLAQEELGFTLPPMPKLESMFGMVTEEALQILGMQAAVIACLSDIYTDTLTKASLLSVLRDIELPLCNVLADMENVGFRVDTAALSAFGGKLSQEIASLEATIHAFAGHAFNIQSPKQLGTVLFEELGLPTAKKTKTGFSVNAEVLEGLQHDIIPPILQYRELCKLKSTDVDGLLAVSGGDGRVHTTFQMTATATGRLSSSEPNLQNIPIRRASGSELRRMFLPTHPDWVLVDCDYSQIELRVLAHIARDTNMQSAFRIGADIHSITASQVFHVPLSDVTPQMRRNAKAVNFGIVFGISDFSLAQDIGVTRAQAKAYIQNYLDNFAGVRHYMEQVVTQAKIDGFVTTMLGRRRFLPELHAANHNTRSFGERAALNTPIQGTAADIIKLAMIAVHQRLQKEGLQARLILQVHDELIVECPEQESAHVLAIVKQEMEQVFPLNPSLVAEGGIGPNWLAAK